MMGRMDEAKPKHQVSLRALFAVTTLTAAWFALYSFIAGNCPNLNRHRLQAVLISDAVVLIVLYLAAKKRKRILMLVVIALLAVSATHTLKSIAPFWHR